MVWEKICQQCHWSPSWLQTGLHPELRSPMSSSLGDLEQVPRSSSFFLPYILLSRYPLSYLYNHRPVRTAPNQNLKPVETNGCQKYIDTGLTSTGRQWRTSSEGLVKQEGAATGQVFEMFWQMFFKEVQAMHCRPLSIHDRQMMCPAAYLDKFLRMAHRNILLWGIRSFIISPPISKNKLAVFLDHQAKNSNAKITQTVLGPSHVTEIYNPDYFCHHCIRKPWWNSHATQKVFAVKNLIRWLYDVAWKEWHNNTWYSSLSYPSEPSMQNLCKLYINEVKRLKRPQRWADMARDIGKECWEGKLTRLEEPHALKISTTCFARILALTLQEFPRS